MSLHARVTMQDVARRAGVHQTTVSLALRQDPRLSEGTRRRIARIADELGYRPHPLLSALGSARRLRRELRSPDTLAFLAYADRKAEARLEHLAGASAAAAEQGYRVEPFMIGSCGVTAARLDAILAARGIHGLLLAPLPEPRGRFVLDWPRFCAVALEYTFDSPAFDRVVHDGYGGMRLVLEQCLARGLRRVGLLLSAAGHERTERLNGAAFWIAQKSSRALAAIPPLYLPGWDDSAFARWFGRWRPEAIVTSSVFVRPVRDFAGKRSLRIPENLSLLNLNTRAGSAAVSGIDQNNAALGATAARLVIDKLHRNDRGVPALRQTVLTPGAWVEGATLRPAAPEAFQTKIPKELKKPAIFSRSGEHPNRSTLRGYWTQKE